MIQYSVIVPHSSSIDTLIRAINSIPIREDIQIIIIDNSKIILDKSQLIDINPEYLLLFSDPAKGAGCARNLGMHYAKGKWLLFLDADDFYNKHAFEWFDEYVNSPYDIVFWNVNSVYSDTLLPSDRCQRTNNFFNEFEKQDDEGILRFVYHTPWCKMIRRSLTSTYNIQFEEVPAANDLMFSVRTGHNANLIKADKRLAYCVTNHKGSIVNSINPTNERSRHSVYLRFNRFIIDVGRKDLKVRLISHVLHSFQFGLIEFLWYIKEAKKYKINVFDGCLQFCFSVVKKSFRISKDKHYLIKSNKSK